MLTNGTATSSERSVEDPNPEKRKLSFIVCYKIHLRLNIILSKSENIYAVCNKRILLLKCQCSVQNSSYSFLFERKQEHNYYLVSRVNCSKAC